MGQSIIEDSEEVVALEHVGDPFVVSQLALRAHPFYANAPQTVMQATLHHRATVPVAAAFAATALGVLATPARGWVGEIAVSMAQSGSDAEMAHTWGILGVTAGAWLAGLLALAGGRLGIVLVAVFAGLALGQPPALLALGLAAVALLFALQGRTGSYVYPAEIDASKWDEFKDGLKSLFGVGAPKILRGEHRVSFERIAFAALVPAVLLPVLAVAIPKGLAIVIALVAGVLSTRVAAAGSVRDPDLLLYCDAVGVQPEAEVARTLGQTHLAMALGAVVALGTAAVIG